MSSNKEIEFRRINGRIVPIRKKTQKPVTSDNALVANASIAAGAGISVYSGISSADTLKKSYKAYNQSAHARGLSKSLFRVSPKNYAKTIHQAASLKIVGKKLASRAFTGLGIASIVGTSLAAYGMNSLLKKTKKLNENQKGAIVSVGSGIVGGIGLSLFGKKAKIGHFVGIAKNMNPESSIKAMFSSWSTVGQARTRALVKKYSVEAEKAKLTRMTATVNKIRKTKKNLNNPDQYNLF